jgi:hypothetical protein
MQSLPVKVRQFALRHKLNVGRVYDEHGGYYYVRDPQTLKIVETTRTTHPKACHAMAMMRRYLGIGPGERVTAQRVTIDLIGVR